MFDWLYNFLGDMLSFFSNIFGGYYVFGLLFYALLFKIVFIPFSIKQQKNQIKMAKLTPQIELIKAKYAGRKDQPTMQKMQQEILDFQQKEGYSPFGGCLPLLLQMPIIFLLYEVIRNPLSYICKFSAAEVDKIRDIIGEAAKNIDQIKLVSLIENPENMAALKNAGFDFENLPNFDLFGINLAETPGEVWGWLVLVPILAAVIQWLAMFLMRKWSPNPAQTMNQDAAAKSSGKIMDLLMPGMTLWFCFSFSGMMGVYWIYQSALGILQSYILAKAMPLPKYTEEEIKAMKRAQKNAEKSQRQTLKEMPKYRSLHYIDEDDYDTLPEVKTNTDTKKNGNMDLPDIN